MNTKLKIAVALALGLGLGVAAHAGDSDSQTVTFEVQAINEISVSGNPGTLTVSTATAGAEPDAVTDVTTTYAITTNETNRKITAGLNSAMPTGVTLTVALVAPTGGTSSEAVTLTGTAADVVTGVGTVAESGLGITYGLSATVAAGVVGQDTKTVTFTITAGS